MFSVECLLSRAPEHLNSTLIYDYLCLFELKMKINSRMGTEKQKKVFSFVSNPLRSIFSYGERSSCKRSFQFYYYINFRTLFRILLRLCLLLCYVWCSNRKFQMYDACGFYIQTLIRLCVKCNPALKLFVLSFRIVVVVVVIFLISIKCVKRLIIILIV